MNNTVLNRNEIHSVINKILNQMLNLKGNMEESCPIGIISMNNWEWPQGVALFATYLYYKESGRKDILDFLVNWFDSRIKEGLPYKNVNTMCPMLTLSYLYEETKNQRYLELCREWVEYAVKKMPRTEEFGIQHVVSGHLNEGQLWDDTLYMTVLFITRMGVILKEDSYIQESIRQFMVHLKYLTDPKTGLFFHGWTFVNKNHFAGALWARGNSWYTAGLVDYLDMIKLPEGVKMFLISSLERQVEVLAQLQTEEGMWHTLLDHQDSYVETSATSAFAYGILKAVRKGYISKKHEEVGLRAFKAVISRIDENGTVQGVSYGTGMGSTLQFYKDIPVLPMPYGQSMAMLMLVEALKHID